MSEGREGGCHLLTVGVSSRCWTGIIHSVGIDGCAEARKVRHLPRANAFDAVQNIKATATRVRQFPGRDEDALADGCRVAGKEGK